MDGTLRHFKQGYNNLLAAWGRASSLSAPHNAESLQMSGEETFCFIKVEYQRGSRDRDLRRDRQAVLTTTSGAQPLNYDCIQLMCMWLFQPVDLPTCQCSTCRCSQVSMFRCFDAKCFSSAHLFYKNKPINWPGIIIANMHGIKHQSNYFVLCLQNVYCTVWNTQVS